jgi:hypothetical protein
MPEADFLSDLFAERPKLRLVPTARQSDPDTSHEAASRVAPKASTDRLRVLHCLQDAGAQGKTDFELAEELGGLQTSLGVRRGELVKLGLVENSGTRRNSPSGSPAIVWRVT